MKPTLLLAFLLALLVPLLSTCGDDDDDEPTTTNSTATSSGGASQPAGPMITEVDEYNQVLEPSWNSIEGEDITYEVRYRDSEDAAAEWDHYPPEGDELTDTNCTLSGLVNGTLYEIQVRWLDADDNESAWSAPATGRPFQLDKPTGIVVVPDDEQLTISWGRVEGAAKYHLRYKEEDAEDYTVITNDADNEAITNLTFVLSNLENGTNYLINLSSVNEFGQETDWTFPAAEGTPTDVLQPPSLALVEDTGDDAGDDLTTNATIRVATRPNVMITLNITVNTEAPVAQAASAGADGTVEVNLATSLPAIVPTGNATNALSITAQGRERASDPLTAASEALAFKMVSGPTQTEVDDYLEMVLNQDTGDNNDDITTDTRVGLYTGTLPDGAVLSFTVTTNGGAHAWQPSTPLNDNASASANFGLASVTELLEVSITPKLTRHAHSVTGDAFEYTLIPWPSEIMVDYEDDGTDDDGVTTQSELTMTTFSNANLPPTDIKIVSYVVTNTDTMMTNDVVSVDLDLSSEYKLDMRDVKPTLGANEKIHSIGLDYVGHTVEYVFDPALKYVPPPFAALARRFSLAAIHDDTDDNYNIGITSGGVVVVASVNNDAIYFFDTNGNVTNLTIGGSSVSTFGVEGSATNQFSNPDGLLIGGDGKVYVGERGNSRIQVFNANFTHNTNITSTTSIYPYRLLLHNGTLYASAGDDDDIDSIYTFAESGYAQGSNLSTSGKNLVAVAVDSDGVHHVLNRSDEQIETWTGSRTTGFTKGSHSLSLRPEGGGEFSSEPIDVAIDPTTGNLFVSDASRHQILVLSYDGSAASNHYTLLGTIGHAVAGTSGTVDGEFDQPEDILIHGRELYVCDTDNNRIQVFTLPTE